MFIEALFTIAKTWKQLKCPSADEWIKKCGIYTQWNTPQPQKRTKQCHLQQHDMELETFILSNLSQKQKDKYHIISLVSGI